jgi:aromatic-L-amino-acid decarboxylase
MLVVEVVPTVAATQCGLVVNAHKWLFTPLDLSAFYTRRPDILRFFVMRYFGRKRIAEMIRTHVCWTQELARMIDADPRFERVAPAPLSVVCFRYRGSDDENRALLDAVNATGKVFLSHAELNGRFVLRIAIGNLGTTRQDVQLAWDLVRQNIPQ